MHAYFAGLGYAAVRVDLRGTGDSDGVLLDEYLPREIEDARDVIRWLAEQNWRPFGAEGMPRDQRDDDDRSVVFDSHPLERRVEILGEPVLRVKISCDRPVAMPVARLEDVFPDGVSARATYGILNLTHHSSHEHPAPLSSGTVIDVELPLNYAAHSFSPGNRARLALSKRFRSEIPRDLV